MSVDAYIQKTIKEGYTQSEFDNFIIQSGGFKKIRKRSLDKIIEALPECTISNENFMAIYRMISTNESGKLISVWTWIVGFTSIISLIISIIGLLIAASAR